MAHDSSTRGSGFLDLVYSRADSATLDTSR